MSKRKLNRRQTWRVEKIQQERKDRASRRAEIADEQLGAGELGAETEGVVITHFGTQIEVEPLPRQADKQTVRCHMRANLPALVTGDRVIWRPGSPMGVVVACRDRSTELLRPDARGQLKPVAANIDLIVIVAAPSPSPHRKLIDRYLVAAEHSNIEPVIVLNKIDLINDENRAELERLVDIYPSLGYRVLWASTKTPDGLDSLKQTLDQSIAAFVGQSGVGKSSIIQALLPSEEIRVGELSEKLQKGRHTTTAAQLYHFPSGGDLVDSPGIREFGLYHLERHEVEHGFREFRAYLGLCKFRDCKHQSEPQCAILEAVSAGEIAAERLESYRHIVAEGMEHQANSAY